MAASISIVMSVARIQLHLVFDFHSVCLFSQPLLSRVVQRIGTLAGPHFCAVQIQRFDFDQL
jgi:hypothetical protein